MKKGFTMIELVFVIVILGILASIAVPKMVATRDDATAAKAVSEIKDTITQLAAYYTIHGTWKIFWDGKDDNTRGGIDTDVCTNTDTNMIREYSRTIEEVLLRANDKWTDCFSMTLREGGIIEMKKKQLEGNSGSKGLCETLKNVPAVKSWLGNEGKIVVGGSGIYDSAPKTE